MRFICSRYRIFSESHTSLMHLHLYVYSTGGSLCAVPTVHIWNNEACREMHIIILYCTDELLVCVCPMKYVYMLSSTVSSAPPDMSCERLLFRHTACGFFSLLFASYEMCASRCDDCTNADGSLQLNAAAAAYIGQTKGEAVSQLRG